MGCGCGGAKLSRPAPAVARSAATVPGFQSMAAPSSPVVVRSQGINIEQRPLGTQPQRTSVSRPTV